MIWHEYPAQLVSVNAKASTQVDVVFEIYEKDSMKAGTRSFREGVSTKRPVQRMVNSMEVPLPNNWKQLIDLEDIKADLAILLFCQVADGEFVTA